MHLAASVNMNGITSTLNVNEALTFGNPMMSETNLIKTLEGKRKYSGLILDYASYAICRWY